MQVTGKVDVTIVDGVMTVNAELRQLETSSDEDAESSSDNGWKKIWEYSGAIIPEIAVEPNIIGVTKYLTIHYEIGKKWMKESKEEDRRSRE